MNKLTMLFWTIVLSIVGMLGYGLINWIVFLNLIESPLPESEQEVPDLGIVDN